VGKFFKGGFEMRGGILNLRCWTSFFIFLIMIFFVHPPVFAVKGTITVTDKEIVERLARLEEGAARIRRGAAEIGAEFK